MSRMVALALLLAGCDSIFSTQRSFVDAAEGAIDTSVAADATPDAPLVQVIITALELDPPDVATNETVAVVLNVVGDPSTSAPFTLSASNGMVAPTSGNITLDATGNGKLMSATFAAPSEPTSVNLSAIVGTARRDKTIDVLALRTFGYDANYTADLAAMGDTVYAMPVLIGSNGWVHRLGLRSNDASGAMAQLGLYNSNSELLFASAPFAIAPPRAVVEVPHVNVPSGNYHIAVHFDRPTSLRGTNGGSMRQQSGNFGSGLPQMLTGNASPITIALFVEVAN